MTVEKIFGIEHLQEATASAGSNLEFRQLEKGFLQGHSWIEKSSECALQYLGPSLSVEAEGDYPVGMHALLSPYGNMVLTQNGVIAQEGEWIFLRSGADAWATNSLQIGDLLLVYFPEKLFDRQCIAMLSRTLQPGATAIKIHPGRNRLAQFNRLARVWRHSKRAADADAAATNIIALLIDAWADRDGLVPTRLRGASSLVAFDRAREFIGGNCDYPIDLPGLSQHVGVSYRTLRRVFASQVGLSPSQYHRIRRLSAIRRDLLDSRQDERSISDIAKSHGIGHLGRFSCEFRRHFGYLPSRLRNVARMRTP